MKRTPRADVRPPALPIGVGLYLVFSPPAGLSESLLLAWLFVTVVITHVSMSLFVVPWTALYAEFSDDYDERTTIVTWRYAVGWLGSIVFIVASWSFIFPSTPAYTPGQLNPHAYALFGPVIAVVVAACVVATTLLTQREVPYLLQPVAETPRFSLARVWRDVSSTFSNRDFLMLFFGALVYSGISGATDNLGTYLQTSFWGLGPEQLRWFQLSILGAVLAFFTLGPLERIFDKKPLLIGAFVLKMIDGIGVTALRLAHLMPPNGSRLLLDLLIANEVARTFLDTLLGIMFVSMLADTIDLQAQVSDGQAPGKRRRRRRAWLLLGEGHGRGGGPGRRLPVAAGGPLARARHAPWPRSPPRRPSRLGGWRARPPATGDPAAVRPGLPHHPPEPRPHPRRTRPPPRRRARPQPGGRPPRSRARPAGRAPLIRLSGAP